MGKIALIEATLQAPSLDIVAWQHRGAVHRPRRSPPPMPSNSSFWFAFPPLLMPVAIAQVRAHRIFALRPRCSPHYCRFTIRPAIGLLPYDAQLRAENRRLCFIVPKVDYPGLSADQTIRVTPPGWDGRAFPSVPPATCISHVFSQHGSALGMWV